MATTEASTLGRRAPDLPETMRAAVFRGHERIQLEEMPAPACGPTDAIVKITLTTICGTDVHIWREEYPVAPGRIVGHEPVGVIAALGDAVTGYEVGDRVLVGAITPCAAASTARTTPRPSARDTRTSGR